MPTSQGFALTSWFQGRSALAGAAGLFGGFVWRAFGSSDKSWLLVIDRLEWGYKKNRPNGRLFD